MVSRYLFFLVLSTFVSDAMDEVPPKSTNDSSLINSLFSFIIDYNYEKTDRLIAGQPSLVDAYGVYDKPGFFCEKITPAHLAALVGNKVALDCLLAVSPQSINAVTKRGDTPLHFASNERVTQLLLEHGARVSCRNKRTYTPLYEALYGRACCHEPYFDVALCLLKAGASVDQKNCYGQTVLHWAAHKNISDTLAHFLLEHGADADIVDDMNHTPFDSVIEHGGHRETFQSFGYSYYYTDDAQDPFELLKKNSSLFFKKDMVGYLMRDLYITAQRQEKKRDLDDHRSAVIIKRNNVLKLYIFKKASFSNLEDCFGKEAVDYMKDFFENLFIRAAWSIFVGKNCFSKVPYKYNINGVDQYGDSLLHTAIRYKRHQEIEWLLHHDIDCTIKNNYGITALDCIDSKDSISALIVDRIIVKKFFERSLSYNVDQFIVQRPFYLFCFIPSSSDKITDDPEFRLLRIFQDRPEMASVFIENGMDVNYKNENGRSPLLWALERWLKKSWTEVPSMHKYNICALLQLGAIVDEAIIESARGYLKQLLQEVYDKQQR